MILIELNGERQLVEALDGYEAWTVLAENVPPPDENTHPLAEPQLDGTWAIPLASAETCALGLIDAGADGMCGEQVSNLRRQMLVMMIWQEVQRLKLANTLNAVPTDALARAKMFPMTSAVAQVYGVTLAQAATAIEIRFWDRVRKMCLAEAKTQQARDAVLAAATAEEKLAAAEAVVWTE